MKSIKMDVWQFVRVMVAWEDKGFTKGTNAAASLYQAWSEGWLELDERLKDLSERDFIAYSELMMEEEVELPIRHKQDSVALLQALSSVVHDMKKANEQPEATKEAKEDLIFEIRELTKLSKRIKYESLNA
ncbi:hypothetical protein N9K16_02560 [Alphaproteobacteria bacterium]|jgi:hypothetical protein|nr:hypothetical protein [Alphaproteobacteria bacterium]